MSAKNMTFSRRPRSARAARSAGSIRQTQLVPEDGDARPLPTRLDVVARQGLVIAEVESCLVDHRVSPSVTRLSFSEAELAAHFEIVLAGVYTIAIMQDSRKVTIVAGHLV